MHGDRLPGWWRFDTEEGREDTKAILSRHAQHTLFEHPFLEDEHEDEADEDRVKSKINPSLRSSFLFFQNKNNMKDDVKDATILVLIEKNLRVETQGIAHFSNIS